MKQAIRWLWLGFFFGAGLLGLSAQTAFDRFITRSGDKLMDGSAGARSYDVERSAHTNGPWTSAGHDISDTDVYSKRIK